MTEEYIPYTVALERLIERQQATVEEFRMWVSCGSQDGGLDAFDDPEGHQGEPRKHGYYEPLVTAFFRRADIESFAPADSRRYLTEPVLRARWVAYGLSDSEFGVMFTQLLEDRRLEAIDLPHVDSDGKLSEITLVPLDQIHAAEDKHFPGKRIAVAAPSADHAQSGASASLSNTIRHNLTRRKRALDAEIETAKMTATDPNDYQSVYAELAKMAQCKDGPFTGNVDRRGIEYISNSTGKLARLTVDALRKRMNPAAR